METIKKIEEVSGYKLNDWDSYEGYKITTSEQEILFLISDNQDCCESTGSFATNDNLDDFIGSEIKDIKIVDTSLNQKKVDEIIEYGLDAGNIMFVNINTDKGTLQLTAYNSHNGYYGHSAHIISNQIKEETTL